MSQQPVTFRSLFDQYVIGSFDKQLRLADAHGEDDWGFNMTAGEITFAEKDSYKTEILGTEDHVSETWLWGWANKASGIPENLLRVGEKMREFGERHTIDELTQPQASMGDVDGHTVGLIASGMAKAQAYYRCPYDNGALFVLIIDTRLEMPVEHKVVRATRVIPECISVMELPDHRTPTTAYLQQLGFETSHDGNKTQAFESGQLVLTTEFDELGRLASLNTSVGPEG